MARSITVIIQILLYITNMYLSHSLDYELFVSKSHARIMPVTLPVLSTMPSMQQAHPFTFCCLPMK